MEDGNQKANAQIWTDRFGAVASGLCAVHCAICAMAPALFAALGLGMLLGHEVEWGLTLVAVGFGAVALGMGWRRHHSMKVLSLMVIGMVGLLGARGIEMGSDHHGEHGSEHASGEHVEDEDGGVAKGTEKTSEEAHGDDEGEEERHDSDHAEGEGEHEDSLHALGAGVGVLAGLLLSSGHVLNLLALRRREGIPRV